MPQQISVVIPLYNKEKHIASTLMSVLAQTFKDYEVIIINDGSTDNSVKIVKSFSDQRIKLFTTKNKGAAHARNYGIKKATSNFVALLDADDYWFPFYLAKQNSLINKYPKQHVFSTAQKIYKYGRHYPCTYSVNFGLESDGVTNYFKSSTISSIIHSSSIVIHKDVFKNVGMFNQKIMSGQDTDLWIRIGLKYPIVFSTKICSVYNFVSDGLFKSTHSMKQKIDLSPYEVFEKNNSDLKKFLDLNRYALAIQSKLWNDKKSFKALTSKIELSNLNKKQRFLLKQNKNTLLMFIKIKENLSKLGIQLSTYK
ncbi:glycosyltransferase family 2 protein [Ichthyenterobacterium magnum]|uniref:Glycosyl transferase family 2 n=1 Tax=Ichthyenterobacterium magnum TaxID=1230530 RepID=A0A420DV04_9FLAO|nr:glycosyltransferase family 2 protein [Ichthyenterobacterium magnum]RKE98106.1 glycosyl transferase family 2 [Ichthyenterobacterium magnum]